MVEIEVCERLMDYWIDDEKHRHPKYHAQVKGRPELWSCGDSTDHAIVSLIEKRPEIFGISINYLEDKQPR